MTKQKIKKIIKREMKEIEQEYEVSKLEKCGIDEDESIIYNRGWYEAYRSILSIIE
ncbi:MAG: hypothetical protein AAB509_01120 [Patescibacteria group bacterium]